MNENQERDIRIRFEAEVAHGKSPSRAAAAIAFRLGMKQAQVREIVASQVNQHREAPKE